MSSSGDERKPRALIGVLAFIALTLAGTAGMTALGVDLTPSDGEVFPVLVRRLIASALGALLALGAVGAVVFRERITPRIAKFKKFTPFLYQLVRRDFKSKYKRSVLGILWTVLNPLLTMLVMTIVFSTLFRFEVPYYPVYLLSAQVLFTFYNEATTMAMNSVLAGASMIKKVDMPKYIFPLSKSISSLVNFSMSLIALLGVILVTGAPFRWTLLLIPIPAFYTFAFALGVGLMLAALMVFFRDIGYLYGIFMTLLTYLTPIFYPISIVPEKFLPLFHINPLYYLTSYFRQIVIYGTVPGLWENLLCAFFAAAALCIGSWTYLKRQDSFILYI